MNLDTTIVYRGWLKSNLNLEKLGFAEHFDFNFSSCCSDVGVCSRVCQYTVMSLSGYMCNKG